MEHVQFVNMVTEAISKLEKQGVLSTTKSGGCLYTQTIGDKEICCIVGHMMPDVETRVTADNYSNSSVGSLFESRMPWFDMFSQDQIKVLVELQEYHDLLSYHLTFKEIISKMRTRIADYSYFYDRGKPNAQSKI